uniref:C-type lectin domain-containing protein n=1 Tax=Panagrolaimus sp. ES5 TaxID=591445 RepID=A0AC34G0R0_9BILA
MIFSKSEATCVQNGGHLVSIHNGFTNVFVIQEAKKYMKDATDFWIGATKNNNAKTWQWTDGSTFDFDEWKYGRPDNSSLTDCSILPVSDGYWIAQSGLEKKPFVCATGSTNL